MTQSPSDRGPGRGIHLGGGCRALGAPNDTLQLDPAASNGKTAALSLPNYHAAYAVLQKAGFEVVGVDLYCALESDGGKTGGRGGSRYKVTRIWGTL